ncbi:MAG TPA: aminotransferase class I/II-fold pyridoxal phosphate-dependent enzyme, partial [Rhodocyclaceae bacterium]|nr:aminotransferase class I/II-fold pyridoxal phosphate-dependent enzyme [Rhodocyclaceae bacterium]
GISRSPALAACYLHEYAGRRLADALVEVGRARPIADPHPALLASMREHYGEADGLAGSPDIELDTATSPARRIDLSANENPLGPSPLALAALSATLPTIHRYPDRAASALRHALAQRHGGGAAQIVLGNGSCEVLDLAARALLSPGQAAIIAPPCFPAYRSAVKRAHGRLVEVPLQADEGFAYRLDRIAAAIDHDTRLIVIGNPNNPTAQGVAATGFGDWLDSLPPQVTVLLDEAYRDYGADQEFGDAGPANNAEYKAPCPANDDVNQAARKASDGTGDAAAEAPAALADGPALVRAGRRVLVLRSFSKLHGLAGLRVGYAFGPADLIASLEAQRPTYNTNTPAQVAALAALDDHAHQTATRRLNASGLNQLHKGLAALGLSCPPGHGNFLLVDFGRHGFDAGRIAAQLAGAGIEVKPGSAFGLPTCLRISVGLPAENSRLLDELQNLTDAARHSQPKTTRE